jgi:hypothetical protein
MRSSSSETSIGKRSGLGNEGREAPVLFRRHRASNSDSDFPRDFNALVHRRSSQPVDFDEVSCLVNSLFNFVSCVDVALKL